jgi:hypothetical protein
MKAEKALILCVPFYKIDKVCFNSGFDTEVCKKLVVG